MAHNRTIVKYDFQIGNLIKDQAVMEAKYDALIATMQRHISVLEDQNRHREYQLKTLWSMYNAIKK